MHTWIMERLEAAPACDVFSLFHAGIDGMGELIHRHTVGEVGDARHELDGEAETIVNYMYRHARSHAECFPSPQRYKVEAALDNDAVGSYMFRLAAKLQNAFVGDSEPATEKGLMGQLMRHNEAQARTNAEMYSSVLDHLTGQVHLLRRQVDQNEERRFETFEVLESLMSEKHARDMDAKKYSDDTKRKDRLIETAVSHLPEVFKRLGGAGLSGSNGLPAAPKSNGQKTNGAATLQAQATLRDVFRVIDRKAIADDLDDAGREKLDDLLGLGADPPSVEVFREGLLEILGSLTPDVATALQENLQNNHPEKALAFLDLLGLG